MLARLTDAPSVQRVPSRTVCSQQRCPPSKYGLAIVVKWIVIVENISIAFSDMINFIQCRLAAPNHSLSEKPDAFQKHFFEVESHQNF